MKRILGFVMLGLLVTVSLSSAASALGPGTPGGSATCDTRKECEVEVGGESIVYCPPPAVLCDILFAGMGVIPVVVGGPLSGLTCNESQSECGVGTSGAGLRLFIGCKSYRDGTTEWGIWF